jgi:plasmid stabilization system protein ParE
LDYKLSVVARRQLDTILDYRHQDAGRASAARLRASLTAGFEHVGAHPRSGRPRPDLTARPYRFWFKQGYWIVDQLRGTASPLIVAIIDGRRDIARLLR